MMNSTTVAKLAAQMVRQMHMAAATANGAICVICGRNFRGGHNSNCAWQKLVASIKEWEANPGTPPTTLTQDDCIFIRDVISSVVMDPNNEAIAYHSLIGRFSK